MSLWAQAQQLPHENIQQIRAIYGEHFPIEVRHFLAPWIEEKFWSDMEFIPDNPQHEQYVANLINSLIQEIENKAASVSDSELFLNKFKLMEAAKTFKQRHRHRIINVDKILRNPTVYVYKLNIIYLLKKIFLRNNFVSLENPEYYMFSHRYYLIHLISFHSNNPMSLYNYIRQCLQTEMRLVKAASGEGVGGMPHMMLLSTMGTEIIQQIEMLRIRTSETGEDLRKMEQEQEAFTIHYHDCTKLNAHIQQMQNQPAQQVQQALQKTIRQKENLEQVLNQKVAGLMQSRLALGDKFKETVHLLNKLQSQVLDEELIRWKREQQLAGNGAVFNSNLDTIQEWCESLAELIWLNRQQIKEAERLKQKLPLDAPGVNDFLPQLVGEITQLLSTLVTSTFIIEKQPPQVMKTNTRFTATVRLLVGGKLNVHMTPPQVKVTIISESQANILLKSDKLGKNGDASGEILNNTGTMEYQQTTRQLSVSFRNMQLKKIKRAEKKGTESVMDEKFSLLFQSQFSVGGGELMFHVWTLSLPVVVIVHGNQEPHAWATVTWDNAFSEPGRVPFTVPDKVPWHKVADTLSLKFRSATGRPLTDENLLFLADKAFRGTFTDANQQLSWAQFCKEPLSERNFTFWEWFYAVMKLTREHLRGPWVDGFILGFVKKKYAEEMLQNRPTGTFLLRFSDSELGGVTIAWVSDTTEVFMLQPFTSKDFAIRSLADRVNDLKHLLYLYPDTAKDVAFTKYYTPFQDNQTPGAGGYVKPVLRTHVPDIYTTSGNVSYPNTPQHSYLQSPDPTRDTPSVASRYLSFSDMF
ncbi:signal transducer and activator of transcription [Holotrichia oblita]|uniref:Signal transducer and activator of transcription n=1 Tax=Holotrichia oblita TaxID=644536 RepID=A0ACB9TBQ7_HOLOL|nr:signal transducer and activator of transcription [Holotrichia oblita]